MANKVTIFHFSCLHLWFLQFFTSVTLNSFSSTNVVDCAGNSYTSLFFSLPFSYFSSFLNFKACFYHFLLFFSVLFSALCLGYPSIFFYSAFCAFCSLFCSLPLHLFTLFIFCHIVFLSNLLTFFSIFLLLYYVRFTLMFYNNSFCSLSVIIHLFRAPLSNTSLLSYLLLLLFFLTPYSFGKDPMIF